jgi:glucokinase
MKRYILGLDIGGTKIAAGLVTLKGELVERQELPTEQVKGFAHSSGQMHRLIQPLLQRASREGAEVAGIGTCAPGPLDIERGILLNPPNLTGWDNLPLREMTEERYGLPVHMDNDANAAGLAEALWGAGVGYEQIFYVTVSTGIGTGIILKKKILHGKSGMAGEGGHVTIHFQDPAYRCNCGNTGCIEAYASGPSVSRRARERLRAMQDRPALLAAETGGDWDGLAMEQLARAAGRGDTFSQGIIRETGFYLGIWLGSVVSLLDPDVIVIGGGVAQIGEPLFRPIREELPRRTINRLAAQTPVVRAHLEKDVGVFGGAALVLAGMMDGEPVPTHETNTSE